MAITIDRKCLLLVVFAASMFKSSLGQCPPNLRNQVINEGESLTLPFKRDDNSSIHSCPSDLVFNIYRTVSGENGTLHDDYEGSCKIDDDGLHLLNSATEPGTNHTYSTAGPYLFQSTSCTITVKVVVIRNRLSCGCFASTTNPINTTFWCAVSYADTAKNDIYANFTMTRNGQVLSSNVPAPERIDPYVFKSTHTYVSQGKSLGYVSNFLCSLEFTAPPEFPLPNMDRRQPEFSDSCNFNTACT